MSLQGELVPVEPLRRAVLERIEDGSLSWSGLAAKLGWFKHSQPKAGDSTRLQRTLGVRDCYAPPYRSVRRYRNTRIGDRLAARIARAAEIDILDLGL